MKKSAYLIIYFELYKCYNKIIGNEIKNDKLNKQMWECGGIFILHEEVDYMLTPKQNMLEVIKGGNPDRFVNQYEAVQLLFHPFMFTNPLLQPGQENVVNAWG